MSSRTLGWSHCAALLLFGSGALHVEFARAQGQAQGGPATLAPLNAPLSQKLPAAERPAEKPATQAAAPAQSAAAGPSNALRAEYDQAFALTLDKPSDPQTLVHFAEVAVKLGDIEGAISALERLLLIDGDEPDVKLELGVLYFRLGSTEAARTYLEDVSTSKDASNEAKERANTFLKELKKP